MNWVGGARNRLKVKHENKLQKEFFERKRQLRGSSRTSAIKRFDKTTGRGSQDLFSLEVIMSAHRKDITKRKGDRIHTSRSSAGNVNCRNSETLCQEGVPTKQLQHILPELSPIRRQLPPTNLEEGRRGNCCSDQVERECIFTSMPSRGRNDDQGTMSNRQAMAMTEAELGSWETTFELGTATFSTK